MLRMFVVSALLVSAAASAVAAPSQPAAKDTGRVACVPLRDKGDRPTGQMVCRTMEQWAAILRANGYERTAGGDHYMRTDAFISPALYLRPTRAK